MATTKPPITPPQTQNIGNWHCAPLPQTNIAATNSTASDIAVLLTVPAMVIESWPASGGTRVNVSALRAGLPDRRARWADMQFSSQGRLNTGPQHRP